MADVHCRKKGGFIFIYQFHKFPYQAYAKNLKNWNVNLTQISVHDPKDST
jgi:hypothetical protein